eukprot:4023834-Heterocapsa_arctica.AAC.1
MKQLIEKHLALDARENGAYTGYGNIECTNKERGEKDLPRTTWTMCRWRRAVHWRWCTDNAEVRTSEFRAVDAITGYVKNETGWMTNSEEL